MHLQFDKYNDEELMKMIILGNHDAFATLAKRHVTNSYKIAFGVLRIKEDAEDIVQDCFLKLWKSPQNFNCENNVKFSTWFSTVVKNRSIDFLRKKREELMDKDFDLEDQSQTHLQIIEEGVERNTLEDAIHNLSDGQKEALELFLDNHKHQESAKIMGISLKANRGFVWW